MNGAAFLDYPVYPPTPVVLLTEEPLNALNEGLQAFGLAKSADLLVATLADVGERRWSQVVASATDLAVKINSRLMVVDTLPAFVGLGGDSENSAGTALAAMRPLQDAAARGVAVLICRHDRKSGGDVTARARGSSAYSGAVDVTISLRKPSRTQDRFRTLEAVGRFRSVPSLVTVELVSFHATPPGSGVVTTIPSETFRRVSAADDPSEDTTTAILLASLPTNEDEAIALTALSEHSGVPESSLRRSLNVLADQGRRGRIGTGTKGDPFRFYLLSPTLNPGVGVDDKKLDRRVTGPRR